MQMSTNMTRVFSLNIVPSGFVIKFHRPPIPPGNLGFGSLAFSTSILSSDWFKGKSTGTVVFCSTIKYTECSGSFTLNQTNDSELNEELLEALCQKTKLFCGPWGRLLLQYPQTPSTDQKISEIIEVSGFYSDNSPHSEFHIVPPYSLTLIPMASQWHPNGIPMASQWHPNGISMASQAFSMWISTIIHGSLVSVVFCSRFLASCRCLTSMLQPPTDDFATSQ